MDFRDESSATILINVFDTTDNLNLVSQRFIPYNDTTSYIAQEIIPTSDGGAMLLGYTGFAAYVNDFFQQLSYSREPTSHFLLKLNRDGELVSIHGKPIVQTSECILVPNPGKDVCKAVLAVQNREAELFLYNLSGQLLLQKHLSQPETELKIMLLRPGTYVYKVMTKGKQIGYGKWVKN